MIDPKKKGNSHLKINKTDVAYYSNETMTGHLANKRMHPLAYGSAQLDGYKWQDTVCLKPFNATMVEIN